MKILITGGTGLIGTNLTISLRAAGYDVVSVGSTDCDLTVMRATNDLMWDVRPDVLIHLAAKVGGIQANIAGKYDFYTANTLINTNVIHTAKCNGIKRIIAAGTGCAYPKRLVGEVFNEDDFLDGIPEETNDAYAYAKRNMLVQLQALKEQHGISYVYIIPANIYGSYDNINPEESHVVPGLISRFHRAKTDGTDSIDIWGTGEARRDFLYIDDCVEAIKLLLDDVTAEGVFNIASGHQVTIKELVGVVSTEIGFEGEIIYNAAYADGQKTRVMSTEKMDQLGWKPRVDLCDGIKKTVAWYVGYLNG